MYSELIFFIHWTSVFINFIAEKGCFDTMVDILTVCPGQSRDIHCGPLSFLYIQDAIYGHNDNITTTDCSIPVGNFCYESTDDFVSFMTGKSIYDIRVPRRNMTCLEGHQRQPNFVQIEYVCVQGRLRWCSLSLVVLRIFCKARHGPEFSIDSQYFTCAGTVKPLI